MRRAWHQLVFLWHAWRAWRRYPSLRFGQLLGNAAYTAFPDHRVGPTVDLYNVDDDRLVHALAAFAGQLRRRS